jgi:hypothetical protein
VGPILIFDKSSLESLNLDEAALLDHFFRSTITPLFFVECLADLEKQISSKSTPEQLVGSLADRTPDSGAVPNVHHSTILKMELLGRFNLNEVHYRPLFAGAEELQLNEKRGVMFRNTPEAEALSRWREREFLEVERNIAKAWRRSLKSIDFEKLKDRVMGQIGPWRKPVSLEDARRLTDTILSNLDPEFLLCFGLELLGHGNIADDFVSDWMTARRPPLHETVPYFMFLLSINVFFCLTLNTQLLSKVKESHAVDLAYLYYLPFCSIFTSKDNFHAEIVPLFLTPDQSFVNGTDLKADLKRLDALYSSLSESELKTGLANFARYPPEDVTYLTTKLWDKHLPGWRDSAKKPEIVTSPEEEKKLINHLNELSTAPPCEPCEEVQISGDHEFVIVQRKIALKKGKWLRFSEDKCRRILEQEAAEHGAASGRTGPSGKPQ